MRIVQVILLIFCVHPSFSAPFRFTALHQQAYHHYWHLRFAEAGECLQAEQAALSGPNGATIYLEDLGDFLQLVTTEDAAKFRRMAPLEEQRLRQLAALDQQSPYFLFAQAEVKLHWAFLKLLFGDHIAGAWSIKKAYQLLKENEAQYPGFLPNKKSLGLLRALLGAVPAKYQWLTSLAGLSGDTDQGMHELWLVAQSADLHAQEALMVYLLAKTYFLGQAPNAAALGKSFWDRQATNPLVAFTGALVLLKAEQAQNARLLLAQCPPAAQFPLMHYIAGNAHLLSGDYLGANQAYHAFLASYLGQNARKDALYKLFLGHWLSGQPGADRYLKRCREEGAHNTEADRHALRFAREPRLPAPPLVRARLLTDGGEYAQAWQTLQSLESAQLVWPKDRIEYSYRCGRVCHKQGRVGEAIQWYDRTIAQSGDLPYYFAPSAALQAGYLSRDSLGHPVKAAAYFAKAMGYHDHEYEQSIRQKAKLALSQLPD